MGTKITYTDCALVKKDFIPYNHQHGCKVFKNDLDNSILFMQLRDDNTCVVDEIEGYTELYQIYSGIGQYQIGVIETKVDVSQYINAGSILKFNYDDVDNTQLFGQEVDDEHIRYYLYNQEISDNCLIKTLKYLGIFFLMFDFSLNNTLINYMML